MVSYLVHVINIIHLEISKATHVIESISAKFHLQFLGLLGRQKVPDGLIVDLKDIDWDRVNPVPRPLFDSLE